jgi:hypothetical protein
MSEVRRWLEGIGLSQYADAFRANDIDLLRQVDDQMLKDIGISTGGHRLRIRIAIPKLRITIGRRSEADGAGLGITKSADKKSDPCRTSVPPRSSSGRIPAHLNPTNKDIRQ